MWTTWGVLSIVQMASNKYLRGEFWGWNLVAHKLNGVLMFGLSMFWGIYAFKNLGWRVLSNSHSLFVFPILIFVSISMVLGALTSYALENSRWQTAKALRYKSLHRTISYFLIAMGFGAVATGIY